MSAPLPMHNVFLLVFIATSSESAASNHAMERTPKAFAVANLVLLRSFFFSSFDRCP